MNKIKEFLFGKLAGRIVARGAVSLAAVIAGHLAANGVQVDPNELSAYLIAGANMAYTAIKEWRDKHAEKAAESKPA